MIEHGAGIDVARAAGVYRVGTFEGGILRAAPLREVSAQDIRRTALRISFLTHKVVDYEVGDHTGVATLDQAKIELSKANLNLHLDGLLDQREQAVDGLLETTRAMRAAQLDELPYVSDTEYTTLEQARDQALTELLRLQDETRVESDFGRHYYGAGFRSPQRPR